MQVQNLFNQILPIIRWFNNYARLACLKLVSPRARDIWIGESLPRPTRRERWLRYLQRSMSGLMFLLKKALRNAEQEEEAEAEADADGTEESY